MVSSGRTLLSSDLLRVELTHFVRACRSVQVRTMRQFAEAEITIPDGPFVGLKYDASRQPYAVLWFAGVDSLLWARNFATGPSQSGKTLTCFIIPILYHLMELNETVIVGLPDMCMARDKWLEDIEPAIRASRYKDLLPTKGKGSRGGLVTFIQFKNGATLRFMSGGGGDKARAGYTARVLVVTEVDGLDESGGKSREADKLTQLETRTEAYAERKRIYGECTVTVEQGRTWREYVNGTMTRICVRCPSCFAHITPEREDLIGFEDADNIIDARERSHFACPKCGLFFTEAQRKTMNLEARAVHRGQEIDEHGNITGPPPKTDTFSLRWNAFNNLFQEQAYIGGNEWKASREEDAENAEKWRLQFAWAKPFVPDLVATITLDALTICSRTTSLQRTIIPAGTLFLSAAMDLGKWLNHWVVIAWLDGAACQVVDYGKIKVDSETLGVELATLMALNEFEQIATVGWQFADGTRRSPERVFIDSGYQTDVVYEFIRQHIGTGRYWPTKGFGSNPKLHGHYSAPKQLGGQVKLIHEQYHISLQPEKRVYLVEINADHWKSFAQKRLTTPLGLPGAMTLFAGDKNTHTEFAKHLTAEKCIQEFIKDKGYIERWEQSTKKNHFLDALYLACVSGHLAGARIIAPAAIPAPAAPAPAPEPIRIEAFVRQPAAARSDSEDSGGGWIRRRS